MIALAHKAIPYILALIIGFILMTSILLIVGQIIDGADQYREDYDRCMKHATNGYDIERCR